MNHKIASILKSYLVNLSWKDKLAGLVQTANIRIKSGEDISPKSFPVSCDIDAVTCINGAYQDLAPDSKKKSVLYFEDKGVSFVERIGNRMKFTSSLRLVGWLNLREIQGESCDNSVTGCGTVGDYVIEVIKALPTTPFSTTDFVSIYISNISEPEQSVDIFSKYTYNENAVQYTMFPYQYFALDLTIDFVIPCVVPQYTKPLVTNWYLPEKDLLKLMHTNLHLYGVGDFIGWDVLIGSLYWSSSEFNNIMAHALDGNGMSSANAKTSNLYVRACRSFTATVGSFSIRDEGPGGGLIFHIVGTTFYEAAPSDQSISQVWSNIDNVAIGTTGTAIGTGQANTTAIINQVGHVTSAAKLCDDLIV